MPFSFFDEDAYNTQPYVLEGFVQSEMFICVGVDGVDKADRGKTRCLCGARRHLSMVVSDAPNSGTKSTKVISMGSNVGEMVDGRMISSTMISDLVALRTSD